MQDAVTLFCRQIYTEIAQWTSASSSTSGCPKREAQDRGISMVGQMMP